MKGEADLAIVPSNLALQADKKDLGYKVIVGKITEASSSDGISRINIVIFSELEYGVQYTPEFEAEGYTLEEGQAFMFDDKNQKAFYDDIYFVKNQ